jgi:hypothetical protein
VLRPSRECLSRGPTRPSRAEASDPSTIELGRPKQPVYVRLQLAEAITHRPKLRAKLSTGRLLRAVEMLGLPAARERALEAERLHALLGGLALHGAMRPERLQPRRIAAVLRR